ncbi:MAG: MerR family transcriptional regulator [Pseudomonas sp.]
MFIGRLAKLTGCTPKAIRLYEQMGLINEPERDGRYRTYNAHHLEIVHLIRRAQIAGFKLAEMSPRLVHSLLLYCRRIRSAGGLLP